MEFEAPLRMSALTLVRMATFMGNALLFGVLPIVVLVLRPALASLDPDHRARAAARLARRLRGMLGAAIMASAIASLIGVLLQQTLVSGLTGGELRSDSLLAVLETTFGRWTAARLPILVVVALLLRRSRRTPVGRLEEDGASRGWLLVWGATTLLLLATSSLSGHAAVSSPRPVGIASDVIHLVAGATWFSGIIALAVVLPDAWRGEHHSARVRILAPAVTRFSTVALISITIVAITGTINSFLNVGSFEDLVASSYGAALSLKILLFLGILAFGAVNHFVIERRLREAEAAPENPASARIFRRTIAVELVLALLIMGLTGLLTGLQKTRESAAPAAITSGSKL